MLPQHNQTSFWIYKFLGKRVSVWCQKKNIFTAPSLNSKRPKTAFWSTESKCPYISVYLRKKIFVPEMQ